MANPSLPHRDDDRVLTFQVHYFYAADLMRKNCEKFENKMRKGETLGRNDEIKYRIYYASWLGYLGVACEGFRGMNLRLLLGNERPTDFAELVPQTDAIGSKIKKHFDPLRKLRNSIFHLRTDADAITEFFSKPERVTWALELHRDLERFLSDYRVFCLVHYTLNNRLEEASDWIGKSGKKVKKHL